MVSWPPHYTFKPIIEHALDHFVNKLKLLNNPLLDTSTPYFYKHIPMSDPISTHVRKEMVSISTVPMTSMNLSMPSSINGI